jgi:hypothetical protein
MKINSLLFLAAAFFFTDVHAATTATQKTVELEYETASTPKKAKTKKVKKKKTQAEAAPQTAPASSAVACNVHFDDITDARKNKLTIGTNGAGPLLPSGVEQWLQDIKEAELVGKTKSWTGSKEVHVKPALTKLYAYAENMNLHGVFSMSVDISIGGETTTRRYRGMGSKANMVNGYGEYATALNYAVQEVMPRLIDDLKSVCK